MRVFMSIHMYMCVCVTEGYNKGFLNMETMFVFPLLTSDYAFVT